MRLLMTTLAVLALVAGCTTTPVSDGGEPTGMRPNWVESVVPEPGADATVPDAVEVDHTITGPDEQVRLIIDGTDVTTYAEYDAGKLRYESGEGPIFLDSGDHEAVVQRVTLPVEGVEYTVLDSFRWEFRVG